MTRHTDAVVPFSTYVAKGTSTWQAEPERSFEYMMVAAEEHGGGWRARYINGEEMPSWQTGPDISQYLAAWGAEGWEAVGMSIATSQMFVLCKRGSTIPLHPANRHLPGAAR